jgi:DNA-binding GntR family transcriptional regulator
VATAQSGGGPGHPRSRHDGQEQICLDRKSLSDQVHELIKRMILSEELRGGERIPEEKIAHIFGVSRTPIREALRKLEKGGLVRIVPHSHAEVIALEPEAAGHIFELRLSLETLAVRRLAARACDGDPRRAERAMRGHITEAASSITRKSRGGRAQGRERGAGT